MNDFNPWDVDSIEAFACLKCPECDFDTKGEDDFQNHANENHPLSCVFFGLKPKIKRLKKDRIENCVESSFIKPKIKRLKLEKSKTCEDNFPLKTEFHDREINSNEMEHDQTEIETDQIDYESVHENDSFLEESNNDTIEDLGKNVCDNEKEHVQDHDKDILNGKADQKSVEDGNGTVGGDRNSISDRNTRRSNRRGFYGSLKLDIIQVNLCQKL